MAKHFQIIIPYRNRDQHLGPWSKFKNALFIEQSQDGRPFNRGKLLNIGALETTCRWLIFCDVDMVPITPIKEIPRNEGVTQLAESDIQLYDYLGGCTMYDRETFIKSGGYHNDYFHRAEDNEMWFNLYRQGIKVRDHFIQFFHQPHPRPAIEFDVKLWQKAQLPRTQNQLQTCEYQVLKRYDNWIRVKI